MFHSLFSSKHFICPINSIQQNERKIFGEMLIQLKFNVIQSNNLILRLKANKFDSISFFLNPFHFNAKIETSSLCRVFNNFKECCILTSAFLRYINCINSNNNPFFILVESSFDLYTFYSCISVSFSCE